jgi:hypothetical protein
MMFNAILNALKSGLQRDRSTYRRAILNASKVGSHFSFYDCACVVTITVSPARITYEDYFFGQIGGSRQDAEWLQWAFGEPEQRRSDER